MKEINLNLKKYLEKYTKIGLLISSKHKEKPLTIYSYSKFTDAHRLWNKITLMSRGIVLDDKGRVVVRPLPKFFNSNEEKPYNMVITTPVTAYEKVDGSIIQVVDDAEYGLIITSKASFNSDQVRWAKEIIIKEKYKFEKGLNYVFELIHPQNRIIVDYGDEESLTLLAVIDVANDIELDINDNIFDDFKKVKKIKKTKEFLSNNNIEGVVIVDKNGYREKVKTAEYIRLVREKKHFSPLTIWRMLSDGLDIATTEHNGEKIDEEFVPWIQEVSCYLNSEFEKLEKIIKEEKEKVEDLTDQELARSNNIYKSLIFTLRKNQDERFKKSIWNLLKIKAKKYERN